MIEQVQFRFMVCRVRNGENVDQDTTTEDRMLAGLDRRAFSCDLACAAANNRLLVLHSRQLP